MEYSFPRYLLAKQSVDDRALNQHVLNSLRSHLPIEPLRVIEVGAGIGTMLRRLVRWDILHHADYVLVDDLPENMDFALTWMPEWAAASGLDFQRVGPKSAHLRDATHDIRVIFELADVFTFIKSNPAPADLLIAHAFLDLLPMPASLPPLLTLTKSLAWLTVNFDGVTILEPVINTVLDEQIERLYHETMDTRPTGGDSRAGRHLFLYLRDSSAEVLAVGASDWVVHAVNGTYPQDEKYFLHFILHFFEESLTGSLSLNPSTFADWLAKRRDHLMRGELIYIAHQMDFLVNRASEEPSK